MAQGVLCALLLLLALPGSPGQAGEYCHGWVGSLQRWHRGFQCPERYDGPEATFCCGTCSLRFCCSSREARLDQGRCPGDYQQPSPRPPVPGKLPLPLVLWSCFLLCIPCRNLGGISQVRPLFPSPSELQAVTTAAGRCGALALHGPEPLSSLQWEKGMTWSFTPKTLLSSLLLGKLLSY